VTDIAANLAAVKAKIAAACEAAGRDPAEVTLVAVGKTHPAETLRRALETGHRVFGENRVQEAEAKWPALRESFPDLRLHMIGHLQSNKAAEAVTVFDVIESVDRPKIARALAKAMKEQGRNLPVFIQVNTGEEEQKGGAPPGETAALVALCRDELGLEVVGLMCIPPLDEEPAPHFALLAKMAREMGLDGLSMGMSADYETAVRLGATHVRVGTSIFGERLPKGAET
jgi:pyridoxal phosphate enzyme (YggS family)